jgi:hypothetical protein
MYDESSNARKDGGFAKTGGEHEITISSGQ